MISHTFDIPQTGCGGFFALRAFHRPRVREFFQNFSEVFLNLSSFRQRRPRAKFFRNVREVEIRLLSKFQLGTTLGGWKNAEKPKRKKVQTLNGRLPPEDGSVRPENLGKRVSDEFQHLIFRRSKKKFGRKFSAENFSVAQSCPELLQFLTHYHYSFPIQFGFLLISNSVWFFIHFQFSSTELEMNWIGNELNWKWVLCKTF